MRSCLVLLPVFMLAAPLQAEPVASLQELAATPLVTVRISENLKAPPDMATLRLSITEHASTAAAALQKSQEETRRLLDAIRSSGIADKDIQTQGVSIRPNYNYETIDGRREQRLAGYIAGNSISIQTRNIARLPTLLDTIARAGVDQLNGPSFGIADPLPLRKEARRLAMARGQVEATEYAANAGFTRVRLLSVEEGISRRSSDVIVMASSPQNHAVAPPPPPPPSGIEPGQIETGVTLTLTYRMER